MAAASNIVSLALACILAAGCTIATRPEALAQSAAPQRPALQGCDELACYSRVPDLRTGAPIAITDLDLGPPAKQTIERIEAALAFWADAEDVGLPGVVGRPGKSWRVNIRKLECHAADSAWLCTYETRPCRTPENTAARGWCRSQRRFVRGNNFSGADGWIAEMTGDMR